VYGSRNAFVLSFAESSLRSKAEPERFERFMNSKAADYGDGDWAELRRQWREGDELWLFRTSGESWKQLMGWEGYALVRDGKVIGAVVTAQN
jgi:hypothetical protein